MLFSNPQGSLGFNDKPAGRSQPRIDALPAECYESIIGEIPL
jgi:hypothetical protein